MKKLIALIVMVGSLSQAFSNEEEMMCEPNILSSYNYCGIGLGPLPIPAFTVGLGRRTLIGDHAAIDVGVSVATLIRINSVRGYGNALWYVNQKPYSQYYIGLGGSVGGIFGNIFGGRSGFGEGYAAPNFIIGKEFFTSKNNKQFFQVETMYPMYVFSEREFVNWAFFNIKYGFAF